MDNYFNFFDLPILFHLDLALLKQKFLENNRKHHPDLYINDANAFAESELKITQNNKAFQVLNNPNLRFHHVLELKGENLPEQLPNDFLFEMMDLNEMLENINQINKHDIEASIKTIDHQIYSELDTFTKTYDETQNEALLSSIKIILLKQKYILRIKDSFNNFAVL